MCANLQWYRSLGSGIPDLLGFMCFTCGKPGGQGEAEVAEAARLPGVIAERCTALAARWHAAAAVAR